MSHEEIVEKVIESLKETKDYDEDEKVGNKDLLFYDHDFTSMDMLDFLFRIENFFDIRIQEGTIEKLVRDNVPEGDFAVDGNLTAKGRQKLMEFLHDTPENIFPDKIHISSLPRYCTVDSIARLVEQVKLGN